jgi:hypothetical protein
MNHFNEYDENITELDISCKKIVGKCDFSRFKQLQKLDCSSNDIIELNNLRSPRRTEAFSEEKDAPSSLIDISMKDT